MSEPDDDLWYEIERRLRERQPGNRLTLSWRVAIDAALDVMAEREAVLRADVERLRAELSSEKDAYSEMAGAYRQAEGEAKGIAAEVGRLRAVVEALRPFLPSAHAPQCLWHYYLSPCDCGFEGLTAALAHVDPKNPIAP